MACPIYKKQENKMSHRQKNKCRSRHHTQTVKPANHSQTGGFLLRGSKSSRTALPTVVAPVAPPVTEAVAA